MTIFDQLNRIGMCLGGNRLPSVRVATGFYVDGHGTLTDLPPGISELTLVWVEGREQAVQTFLVHEKDWEAGDVWMGVKHYLRARYENQQIHYRGTWREFDADKMTRLIEMAKEAQSNQKRIVKLAQSGAHLPDANVDEFNELNSRNIDILIETLGEHRFLPGAE